MLVANARSAFAGDAAIVFLTVVLAAAAAVVVFAGVAAFLSLCSSL